MSKKSLKIIWHHLQNFRACAEKNHKGIVEHFEKSKYQDEKGEYVNHHDKTSIEEISKEIRKARKEKKIIIPTSKPDFICENCATYNGSKCTHYSEDQLLEQDRRTRDDLFPSLKRRKTIPIKELFECEMPPLSSFYLDKIVG